MATNPNPNHHIVIAALHNRERRLIGYTAVSAPLEWHAALARYEQLETERRARGVSSGRRQVGHIGWYAVRGVSDPQWADLVGQGYLNAIDRKTGRRSSYGDEGIVKAAKAWAKMYGYTGRAGGWIYTPNGEPFVQGWRSFAEYLKRRGDIALGDDKAWYVLDREVLTTSPLNGLPLNGLPLVQS